MMLSVAGMDEEIDDDLDEGTRSGPGVTSVAPSVHFRDSRIGHLSAFPSERRAVAEESL